MTPKLTAQLSGLLGITCETLDVMEWGRSGRLQCWTVPMRDDAGNIIGIRTRYTNGMKKALAGSKAGLIYIPKSIRSEFLIVCEGPTDTASIIDAGFDSVVGRPSCQGGAESIVGLIRLHRPEAVLVVLDRDEPNSHASELTRCGAIGLINAIVRGGLVHPECIASMYPPNGMKDCREVQNKNPGDLAGSIGARIRSLTNKSTSTEATQ